MVRGDTTHVRTCPGQVDCHTVVEDHLKLVILNQGEDRSLLHSLTSTRLKLMGKTEEREEL